MLPMKKKHGEGTEKDGNKNKYEDREYHLLYVYKQKSTVWFKGTPSERGAGQETNDALFKSILSIDDTKVKTENDLNALRKQRPLNYSNLQGK